MTPRAPRLAAIMLAAVFALTLVATPAAAQKAKYVWKTATLAPKGVGYANRVRDILIPAIEEASEGEIHVKVYWGGIMGDDEQALNKMRIGQLHAAGLSGQGTFLACPEVPVLGLPFLFDSYDEVEYVKTQMIGTFDELMQKRGMKLLLWLDQDFDQIYSADHPVATVQDFSKVRFATWFGPLEGKMLQALGGSPSPIGVNEIPPAMRQGVVDAMIAPSIWVVGTQLYSVFRYVNPVKIRYTPAFLICTTKAWNELPKEYRDNITNIRLPLAREFNEASRKDAADCLRAMLEYGVKKVDTSPEDLAEIERLTRPVWDELAGELYPRSLLDEVVSHIRTFREEHPDQ